MSQQSIKQSFIESFTQVMVGMLISFVTNFIVFPLFGIETTVMQLTQVTLIFWCIGLIRNILTRRFFNYIFSEKQSKSQSVIETISMTIISILISFFGSIIIYPLCGLTVSITHISYMTIIFTIISFSKSYIIRRWFNNI